MFSKKEIDYLKGDIKPNQNYAKTLRKRINRKLRVLLNDDIPLLLENENTRHWVSELGYLSNLRGTENSTRGTKFNTPRQQMETYGHQRIDNDSIMLNLKTVFTAQNLHNASWRRGWESNPRIFALQANALPFRHPSKCNIQIYRFKYIGYPASNVLLMK